MWLWHSAKKHEILERPSCFGSCCRSFFVLSPNTHVVVLTDWELSNQTHTSERGPEHPTDHPVSGNQQLEIFTLTGFDYVLKTTQSDREADFCVWSIWWTTPLFCTLQQLYIYKIITHYNSELIIVWSVNYRFTCDFFSSLSKRLLIKCIGLWNSLFKSFAIYQRR